MNQLKKPKGTFRCLMGHILDGSQLMEGVGKRWICPRTNCFYKVVRVKNKPLSKLYFYEVILLKSNLYPHPLRI